LEPIFKGEGVVHGEYFLVSTKLHILLSDSANYRVLRAIVLTQHRRVTDGQTDGIAVASTALTMRALRHGVKMLIKIALYACNLYFLLTDKSCFVLMCIFFSG